jgi:hypothetical protein
MRQTVIQMQRDPRGPPTPSLDELKIFELLEYDYDGSSKTRKKQHRPFSELKAMIESTNPNRKVSE